MSKRNKGTHGIYDLTCISDKCSRRFKVIWDVRTIAIEIKANRVDERFTFGQTVGYAKLTYPFNGCPFCGAWWPTGPLDGEAYPKKPKPLRDIVFDPAPLQAWIDAQGNELA
ncbi:hypothetical protein LCGC14_0878790 [marine sediment metagenome]|uniref:Uncharacterized protein n=1 Tax=marine sediment metagenome TaxID=412755 RepID=A0A0F9P7F3_9ZZZZ